MARGRLDWRGREMEQRVELAARIAIDETMAEAVREAKVRTPVRTGTLQGSIRFEPARREGNRVVGRWGSFDVNYALFVEVGHHTRSGSFVPGRYMLRQGADIAYPKLRDRLRRALR